MIALPFRRLGLGVAAAVVLAGAPAAAQDNLGDTYTFLATVAVKGQQCDLIERWESATILAETDRFLNLFPPEQRGLVMAAAEDRIAATDCDDTAIVEWISGARPGIETEWLPPNLALVKALIELDSPPQSFIDLTADIELEAASATIDAQFVAFADAGIGPEGGGSWDAFFQSVGDVAEAMASAAIDGDNDVFSQNEATAFISDATEITLLWLEAQQGAPHVGQ